MHTYIHTPDHLHWCETNPPDPWPSGLSVSPHLKPLQRCSVPKNDVYSSASTGGIYPPASSPLSPAGIVPATRFVQPRCSPDEIHHRPLQGPFAGRFGSQRMQYLRLPAAVASPSGRDELHGPPNIRGFKQPSRALPASSLSGSSHWPCSKIDFTFLPFSRVF